MLPGLIFDLDGTLVDSLPGIAASLNRALASRGHAPHAVKDVRRFIGNGSRELARRALPEGSARREIEAVEQAFKDDYAVTWPEGTRPFEGIREMLDALARAGSRLAVLSNKPHDFTVEIVSRLFPSVAFDPVCGQRDDVPRKPHPEAAWRICRHWALEPGNCRFVGDSTVDLETAAAAGIPALAVTWGYHDRPALAAFPGVVLVENPGDFPTLAASD